MNEDKNKRAEETLKHEAAAFINEISNKTSLITVPEARLSPSREHLTVYISVYPEEKSEETKHFLERNLHDLRERLGKRIKMKKVPFVSIEVLS